MKLLMSIILLSATTFALAQDRIDWDRRAEEQREPRIRDGRLDPRDPYPRNPRDHRPGEPRPGERDPRYPFPRDPYPRDPYPRDPYPRDPYPRDPYPRDPYPRDPYPRQTSCQSNLVDIYNRLVRTFTGTGYDYYSACAEADRMCQDILYRNTSIGYRCVRSTGGYPYPDYQVTERCYVTRFDPAGYRVQSYTAEYTGAQSSDPKRIACSYALSQCSRDVVGRQYCREE